MMGGPKEADARGAPLEPLGHELVGTLAKNHGAFLGFLEKRVGSRDVAEDLLQGAFARGLSKLATLESEERALAWFYRVLRNAVIDHHRRGGANERALSGLARELREDVEPDFDSRNAPCGCVGTLAGALKLEYSEALQRIELDGVSVQEFAAEAGITANNAGVRLFRARAALRERVASSCGSCAEHGCIDCTCRPQAVGSREP
jgi:RNA polymerase sigma-70 factor (ECF subfamily)